jgi:hypothetical protein
MKEIFHFLAKEKVSPNGWFVLHCMRDNYMIVEYVNHRYEQYKLEQSGHLEQNGSVIGHYNITAKGFELLRKVDEIYVQAQGESPRPKAVKQKKEKFEDWINNIIRYNELFPKGKKEGTSVSFRTAPKELYDKFVWFFSEYPEYTWDHVMEATKRYTEEFHKRMDYQYMQTSKYFIKKEDKNKTVTSTLATMCYNIAEGNDVEIDDGRYYFGP